MWLGPYSSVENTRLAVAARVPLVDPINVLQANVLLRMRCDENQVTTLFSIQQVYSI